MWFKDHLKQGYFSFLAAVAAVIIMPIHVKYLPPFMILWILVWLLENHSALGSILINQKRSFIALFFLFISYYFWQAAGLIYSADVKMGLLNLFGRLSLLLFPVVLISPGEMIKSKIKIILRYFAAGSFLFMVYCFSFALYKSVNLNDGLWSFNPHPPELWWLSYFYAQELTLSQHPSYISLYVLVSIFISFESWFDYSLKTAYRILWLLCGLLLLVSIYFLSSRAGILSTLILIPLYFMFKFREFGKFRFAWIGVLIFMLALLPLIVKNQRVSVLYNSIFQTENEQQKKKEPRFVIWDITLKIVKQNLLLGVGIGDVRTELAKEFDLKGEELMARERYNVHNQFLEVLLENGIIGLVTFVMIFFIMGFMAYKDENLLYGLFILIILFFFMFETVLYRLAGVSFFSLFSFLLYHLAGNKTEEAVE